MTPRTVRLPKTSDQLRSPGREHRSGFPTSTFPMQAVAQYDKLDPLDRRCPMSAANVAVGKSVQEPGTRRVSIRRDGEDFVVVSLAEDLIVYRNSDASALRKLCRSLRWEIVLDSCVSADS